MARGRRRKPTQVKILQGTFREDRSNPNEPKPKVTLLECPESLDRTARMEWERLAPMLEQNGLLTELDYPLLEMFCEARSKLLKAREALQIAGGYTYTNDKGDKKPSPWLRIEERAIYVIKEMANHFGLSPAARTRIKVEGRSKPDPLSKFIRDKQKAA